MNGIKAGIPVLYGAAVLAAFFVSSKAGVVTIIVGGIVTSALYTIIARSNAPAGSRRPPRNRDRSRRYRSNQTP